MTATDELRRLLDERGVEWWPEKYYKDECTIWRANGMEWRASKKTDGKLLIGCTSLAHLTPEQAIAATLGTGTCRLVETEHEQEIAHEFGDGYFTYWSYDCDNCGHENTERGRFCAGCGAMVVDE